MNIYFVFIVVDGVLLFVSLLFCTFVLFYFVIFLVMRHNADYMYFL